MAKVTKFDTRTIQRLALPPDKAQLDVFETLDDGRSLVLTIGKRRRTWSVLFYDRGKPHRKKLGLYPDELDHREARRAAREFDVGSALATARTGSFKVVAEQWMKMHVQAEGLRSQGELQRHLDRYIFPKWEKVPFTEIRRRQVNELLDEIAKRHGTAMCDSVLATVRNIMGWFESRDEDYQSPVVRRMRRGKATRRDRWLSDHEIRLLWEATEKRTTYDRLIRFLLLSGQRKATVGKMRWSDLNLTWEDDELAAGVWNIARQPRMKGTPAAITLTRPMLDLLADQPRVAGNEFVFFGRGETAFNSWSQNKVALDKRLPSAMPRWTVHDLRRTARRLMTRGRVVSEIAEMTLGHAIPGIRGVYDDPAEYRAAIDAALEIVANEIMAILTAEG